MQQSSFNEGRGRTEEVDLLNTHTKVHCIRGQYTQKPFLIFCTYSEVYNYTKMDEKRDFLCDSPPQSITIPTFALAVTCPF